MTLGNAAAVRARWVDRLVQGMPASVEPDPVEMAARYGAKMLPNAVVLFYCCHSTHRGPVVVALRRVAAQLQLHPRQLADADGYKRCRLPVSSKQILHNINLQRHNRLRQQ